MTTSTLTDARQVRTRAMLLQALLHLLETRPFDQVTIREIAREAGIGYATFFRHYASKEALLNDLATDEIAELLNRALPVLYSSDVRQSCVTLFSYVDQKRGLWSGLLTGGAAPLMKQEFTQQAIRLAEESGEIEGVIPADLRVVVAVSATVEILAWWLAQGAGFPVARIAEVLEKLVVIPSLSDVPPLWKT